MNRRKFIKNSLLTSGAAAAYSSIFAGQTIITGKLPDNSTEKGELLFKPFFVQKGEGPHLLDWAYATDKNWDAFFSNIHVNNSGVVISDTQGVDRFGIDVFS